MNTYLFLIRFEGMPPKTTVSIDAFMEVTLKVPDRAVLEVARKFDPTYGVEEIRALAGMKVRAMMEPACYDKPLVIRSEEKLDRDMLATHLEALIAADEFEQFVHTHQIH